LQRPEFVAGDFASGRYRLVMGALPISYALAIDLATAVPWRDWPMDPKTSPVRVTLEQAGQRFVVQPGAAAAEGGWHFDFRKVLARTARPSSWSPNSGCPGPDCPGPRWPPGRSPWPPCWAAPTRCGASASHGAAPRNCCGWGRSRG
jgi:hypothetical protein